MATERQQTRFTDEAVEVLRAAMVLTDSEIRQQVRFMLENAAGWDADRLDTELQKLFSLMNDAEAIFVASATSAIPGGFEQTSRLVAADMRRRGLDRRNTNVDLNAVQVLLRDASIRYHSSNLMGQESARVFFKAFSKQGRMTEAEISEHLAHGLITKQDARESLRILNRNLVDAGENVIDEAAAARFRANRLSAFRKRLLENGNLSDALRAAHLEKKRRSLEAGRVLQLVDKNGTVRTYETRTYAELVTRTKVADAQVEGTIQTGQQFGVQTWRVTSHNTETAICKPHENQIYTSASKSSKLGRLFPRLNQANRPTYHVNCRHRLLAFPMLDEEIDEIKTAQELTA